jgi:hypothetical protein
MLGCWCLQAGDVQACSLCARQLFVDLQLHPAGIALLLHTCITAAPVGLAGQCAVGCNLLNYNDAAWLVGPTTSTPPGPAAASLSDHADAAV